MVGHSLGGLIVCVFTHDYASEVAGFVFVDSMNPKQVTESLSNSLARMSFFQALLARVGVARLLVKMPTIAPKLGPDQEAYPLYIRPGSLQTTANEYKALPDSAAQAAAVKSFGDLPLIVLTGRLHTDPPEWQTWQTELLKLSSYGHQLFAENGNHVLQREDPNAVVAAILKMVELVR